MKVFKHQYISRHVFAYLRFNLKKKQDFIMRLPIKAQIRSLEPRKT